MRCSQIPWRYGLKIVAVTIVAQAFIPAVVDKIARVKAMIGTRPIHIEVDGGVTAETAPLVAAAGADVLVAGSAVFKGGTEDAYRANIAAIRKAADGAERKAA
jgi:ribulose-phosphate 3-epimerase